MTSGQPGNDLLFVYLALQNGFLTRDQLVLSISQWLPEKSVAVRDVVRNNGWMDDDAIQIVDQLVAVHSRSAEGNIEDSIRSQVGPDPELEKLTDLLLMQDSQKGAEESIKTVLESMVGTVRTTADNSRQRSFLELDEICNQYEQAWRAGQSPSLAEAMSHAIDSDQRKLITDLLLIDLRYRLDRGKQLTRAQYQEQFPGYADAIKDAFDDLQSQNDTLVTKQAEQLHETRADEEPGPESRTMLPSSVKRNPGDESPTIGPSAKTRGAESPTMIPLSGDDRESAATIGGETVGGRFKVIRPLAKGGLGQVSIAEDTELNREVALKELLSQHAGNMDLVERFHMEAEITGRLEHPGVVPVYGRGTHEDGAGYYVMRFVRGEELKAAVKNFHETYGTQLLHGTGRVEFIQLLRQFVDVCNTIGYAHSRGIIHRDLKPSNIMLGKYGETFVVDWGLAKPVDAEEEYPSEGKISVHNYSASGTGSQATQMGSTVGTPEFMSPEQADGRITEIGPISDIYCLGATLYYVLTKQPPVSGNNLYDIVERVSAGDIRNLREINSQVPKALEAICLKAVALKPEDRYQTADELAADIEKWIADEPVSVAPDSLLERGRRWFRHHRGLAVTALVSLAVVAVMASTSSIWINRLRLAEADQRGKAEKATGIAEATARRNLELATAEKRAKEDAQESRREALANFKQARSSVDTALTGISEILKYYPGVQRARVGLLEKVADDYLKFASQKSDDPEILLESGRAFLRLGEVRQTLNELDRAEEAFRRGEKRFRDIQQRFPTNSIAPLEVAASLTKLAIISELKGEYGRAAGYYDQVVLDLRNRVKSGDQRQRAREGLAMALSNQASLELTLGKPRLAEAAALESLSLYESLRKNQPEENRYTVHVAQLLNILGNIKNATGRAVDANRDFQNGIDLFESLLKIEPEYPPYLQARASLSISLAIGLRKLGNVKQELAAFELAIEDYQQLVDALPDIPEFQENLALTQTDVAQVWQETGDSRKAVVLLTSAIRVFDALYQQHADVPRYAEELGACSDVLGRAHAMLGDLPQASRFLGIAIELFDELVQANPSISQYGLRLAIAHSHLAELLAIDKQSEKAVEKIDQSIQMMTKLVAANPELASYSNTLAQIISTKAGLLADSKQPEQAAKVRQQAIKQWEKTIQQEPAPSYQYQLARFLVEYPNHLAEQEKGLSLEMARKCIQTTPLNADYQSVLAMAHALNNSLENAQQVLEEARKMRSTPHARDSLAAAVVLARQEDEDAASKAIAQARQWLAENQPGNSRLARFLQEVELYVTANK